MRQPRTYRELDLLLEQQEEQKDVPLCQVILISIFVPLIVYSVMYLLFF